MNKYTFNKNRKMSLCRHSNRGLSTTEEYLCNSIFKIYYLKKIVELVGWVNG